MHTLWLAALVGAASALAVAAPAPASKPSADAVAAVVSFRDPLQWKRSDYANSMGADPVVSFAKGSERISVYVYGAPGSAYKTPEDFLKGPAATSMGRPAERIGDTRVNGRNAALYRRSYPLGDYDPDKPETGPARLGEQLFCVLPPAADGRFAVLAHDQNRPRPGTGSGGDAWKAFLKTVKPAGPKP
ncbi:MAG TPA: hypothetical protein VN915_16000 [Elusimicrobiota bacterium]|nr:hypothetical protein [Elusimicrobiota bacterium]